MNESDDNNEVFKNYIVDIIDKILICVRYYNEYITRHLLYIGILKIRDYGVLDYHRIIFLNSDYVLHEFLMC